MSKLRVGRSALSWRSLAIGSPLEEFSEYGREARELEQLRHALARMPKYRRQLLMSLAQQMARGHMGHASLHTTNRYVHLTQQHLERAQKRMEAYRVEHIMKEAEAATQSQGLLSVRPQ